MHAFTMISLAGVSTTAFLVVRVGVQPSENRAAALAFSGFLLCCAMFVFDDAYMRERWFVQWPWFYGLALPFVVSIGPFFLIYAEGTTGSAFRWKSTHLLHFVVPLLFFALAVLMVFVPASEKIRLADEDLANMNRGTRDAASLALLAFTDAYMLGYLGAAWWRLWRWRDRVAEEQEEGRSHPVRGIGLFATVVLLIAVLSAAFDFSPWPNTGAMITALAVVITLFALLWLSTQPHPFVAQTTSMAMPRLAREAHASGTLPFPATPVATVAPRVAVAEPVEAELLAQAAVLPEAGVVPKPAELKPDEAERVALRVRRLLETDRVFLDPELSLHVLAERAKTTRHKLSAVLKQCFGQTFYQLISGYRVREAAQQLESKQALMRNIADIAFASGFNTLSAFNSAFRAHLGMTPREYRDRAQKS